MRAFLLVVALVLASCLPARAAVTFDANATADCTANAATAINCSTLTVGTGSNRALVCQIVWSGTNSAITVTWDNGGTNQAMTAITNATATSTAKVVLYGLVNPTSGAKQLRTTWTTSRDVYVNCVSWTGVDQTGGTTSFPHGVGATGPGSSTIATVTVTSAVGNAVVAAHTTSEATSFASVNNTQTFIDNAAANMDGAGNRAAGASSVVMTASFASGNHTFASAGTDIQAVACVPSLTLLGVGRCN